MQRPAGGLVAGGLVGVATGLPLPPLHEEDSHHHHDYQYDEHHDSGYHSGNYRNHATAAALGVFTAVTARYNSAIRVGPARWSCLPCRHGETRDAVAVQSEAVKAGAGVGAVIVDTRLGTVAGALHALVHISAGSSISSHLESEGAATREGALRILTLLCTFIDILITLVDIGTSLLVSVQQEAVLTRAGKRSLVVGAQLLAVVCAFFALVNGRAGQPVSTQLKSTLTATLE